MDPHKYYHLRTGIGKLVACSVLVILFKLMVYPITIDEVMLLGNATCGDEQFNDSIITVLNTKPRVLIYDGLIILTNAGIVATVFISLVYGIVSEFVPLGVFAFLSLNAFTHFLLIADLVKSCYDLIGASGTTTCPLTPTLKSFRSDLERCTIITILDLLILLAILKYAIVMYKMLNYTVVRFGLDGQVVDENRTFEPVRLNNRQTNIPLGVPPSYEEAMQLGRVSLRQLELQIERQEREENSISVTNEETEDANGENGEVNETPATVEVEEDKEEDKEEGKDPSSEDKNQTKTEE